MSLLHTIDLNSGYLILVERSITPAPDTGQDDEAEQPSQDYAAEGEQALGYDSDYASAYDYPTTEDNNGTLSMEAVSVFQRYHLSGTGIYRFLNSRTQTTTTKAQWNTNHTMDMNKKPWMLRITISLLFFYVNR